MDLSYSRFSNREASTLKVTVSSVKKNLLLRIVEWLVHASEELVRVDAAHGLMLRRAAILLSSRIELLEYGRRTLKDITKRQSCQQSESGPSIGDQSTAKTAAAPMLPA